MSDFIILKLSSDAHSLLIECVESSITFLDSSLKLPLKKVQKLAIQSKKSDFLSLLNIIKSFPCSESEF